MTPSRRRLVLDALALGLVAAGALALAIDLSVRDAQPFWARVFYAIPLPLAAALFVAAAMLWLGNRRRGLAGACLLLSALTALLWTRGAYHTHPCANGPGMLQVMTWNTARGLGGWPTVARRVASSGADIIGLVEAGGSGADRREFWSRHFPGYEVHLPGAGLAILTRGRLVQHRMLRLPGNSSCCEAWIEIEGRLVRVLLVDAVVRPFSDRRPVLSQVLELASSSPDTPTIVMGDFNTPFDSVWFDPLRADFVHAFEEAGNGWMATWPVPLPVLALDHVWVSREMRVRCARMGWTWTSDHRPVLVQVDLGGMSAEKK